MSEATISPVLREPPNLPAAPAQPTEAPPRGSVWIWVFLGLLLLVAASIGVWLFTRPNDTDAAAAAKKKNQSVPIVVTVSRRGDLPIYLEGLGTVTALNTVTVRSRVDGELQTIAVKEGQMVRAGDFLAQIDPRPFQVQKQQAEGQLARDQAALANAQKDVARYQEAGDAVSVQQRDTAISSVSQYEGAVKSDDSQVKNAVLQIAYAYIAAPISGRIGLRQIDAGNMIHATDVNGLAIITQLQPITVVFNLPQDDIPKLMRRIRDNEIWSLFQLRSLPVPVVAWDRDFKTQLATGMVLAVDNQVDPGSGTIRIKAIFSNEDEFLFPNQFVNARLLVDMRYGATLVRTAAVQRGPDFNFVYVVKADQTVEVRKVVVGPAEGDLSSITKGLAPGETVAVDGVDKLTAGTKVTPQLDRKPTSRPASGPSSGPASAPSAGGATGDGDAAATPAAGSVRSKKGHAQGQPQ